MSVILEQIPKEHRAGPESYTNTLNCKIIARAHDNNSLGPNGYTEKMLMLKKEMTTMSREKKGCLLARHLKQVRTTIMYRTSNNFSHSNGIRRAGSNANLTHKGCGKRNLPIQGKKHELNSLFPVEFPFFFISAYMTVR